MIDAPELALAPVIAPVITPTDQLKLLEVLEVKVMAVDAPLHIVLVEAFVTAGIGLTVTVIVNGLPTHEPPVDVGVTTYSTVPAVELPGLVNV